MNANAPRNTANVPNAPIVVRRRSSRNERAFGTGYGRSSGYADNLRRYTAAEGAGRFRVH